MQFPRAATWRLPRRNLASTKTNWTDSIEDLARESGDQRVNLQQELAARQAAMKQYRENASKDDGQTAVASAEQYRTLAQQLSTWRSLRNRKQLIVQAEQLARADVAALTGDQATLKTEAAGLGDKGRWRIRFRTNRPAATDKRSAKHPEHPQRSSGRAHSSCWHSTGDGESKSRSSERS